MFLKTLRELTFYSFMGLALLSLSCGSENPGSASQENLQIIPAQIGFHKRVMVDYDLENGLTVEDDASNVSSFLGMVKIGDSEFTVEAPWAAYYPVIDSLDFDLSLLRLFGTDKFNCTIGFPVFIPDAVEVPFPDFIDPVNDAPTFHYGFSSEMHNNIGVNRRIEFLLNGVGGFSFAIDIQCVISPTQGNQPSIIRSVKFPLLFSTL